MKIFRILIFILILVVIFSVAQADFTSTNFQLENPINIINGGESSSSNFQYLSTTSQLTQGISTSGSFAQNTGFLYFPTATSPVVSATPGDAQAVLSWTAATGILANITSYSVGVSASSGGTFTYTSVGNVLTYTKTSLINGTPYFFKVRSFAAGLLLSESAEVSTTPASSVTPPSSGGGGGGGYTYISNTGAIFSGMAYPGSKVFLLKDGQIAASTLASGDAQFKITLTGLSAGDFIFLVYAEDGVGRRSTLLTFPITLTFGAVTEISGIFIAPTISVDKTEVKQGDNVTILGQSVPEGQVVISVNSDSEKFVSTATDKHGGYVYNFDTSVLELGAHLTKSKASKVGEISPFGRSIAFKVGVKTVLTSSAIEGLCNSIADLNNDCRVNLIDYSILAFWYKKALPPPKVDLNHDGKVDIIDFSIMAYYWTM
ncbi:MAG: hypothetical protein AAB595_02755 [Patescibacteria group bacterium]